MSSALPFTVIGGYLGAGKTTLLNHLLNNTQGLRIAVLVNDFGSINIDTKLIRSHDGDTINLANGCMCCTMADNFAITISQLLHRANDLDRIVIEASGVADPAKIAHYGQMYHLPLDGILVVADAEQVRTQAQNKYVGDTVIRQFAQADLILLNKTDLVSSGDRASLRAWLAEISPGTPVIETVYSQVPMEVLLGSHLDHSATHPVPETSHPLHNHHQDDPDGIHDHQHPDENHARLFQTWTVERSDPITRQVFDRFAAGLGEDVYRVKGFVYLEGDQEYRYVYQQVGSRWSLKRENPWATQARQTQLVVIGRPGGTSEGAIAALLWNQRILQSFQQSPHR